MKKDQYRFIVWAGLVISLGIISFLGTMIVFPTMRPSFMKSDTTASTSSTFPSPNPHSAIGEAIEMRKLDKEFEKLENHIWSEFGILCSLEKPKSECESFFNLVSNNPELANALRYAKSNKIVTTASDRFEIRQNTYDKTVFIYVDMRENDETIIRFLIKQRNLN